MASTWIQKRSKPYLNGEFQLQFKMFNVFLDLQTFIGSSFKWDYLKIVAPSNLQLKALTTSNSKNMSYLEDIKRR